jgi:hypothetical protein
MNRNVFFLIVAMATTICVQAQFRINPSGYVGIGTTNPSNRLHLNFGESGKFILTSWYNTYIDPTGSCGATVFYPQNDWYLQLGTSSKRVGTIFVFTIHTNDVWCDSDERIKTDFKEIPQAITILNFERDLKSL